MQELNNLSLALHHLLRGQPDRACDVLAQPFPAMEMAGLSHGQGNVARHLHLVEPDQLSSVDEATLARALKAERTARKVDATSTAAGLRTPH